MIVHPSSIGRVLIVALICASSGLNHAADGLQLGRPFSDHMVVQKGVSLPVWGKSRPGQQVTVTWSNESQDTVADEQGHWKVAFPGRDVAREPSILTIRAGGEQLEVSDILVGEVWLCAGQSNMAWPVSASATAKETLSRELNPEIRLLNFRGMVQSSTKPYTDEMIEQLAVDKFYKGHWELGSLESIQSFSAVGYYFGETLQRELAVPIGLISVPTGGSPAEAWVSRSALASHPQLQSLTVGKWLENEQLSPWCRRRAAHNLGVDHKEESSLPGDALGPNHSFKPGFLWEAGVAPLVPFPIQGVIWYQGESNAEYPWRIAQHEQLFPLLIEDWRNHWNRRDMPFLYAQLSAIERPYWPAFRESQRRMQARIPHTAMVVTLDRGHPTDVHPRDKRPVGERLARWALATVYGRNDAVYSSPLYQNVRFKGATAVVTFDHTGAGLQSSDGKPITGFELSEDGTMFYAARATVAGDTVIVSSGAVPNPRYVRYGWQPYPEPTLNLINSANLPASPFTTVEDFIAAAERDRDGSE